MSAVNKVILIGRLGNDPDIRHTQSGQQVTNFSIATNEKWTGKDGQKQERVEWHKIVAWGKLAEICGKYLQKGRQAYVEGKLQTRQWTDKEGLTRYTTEVVAEQVMFLGQGGNNSSQEDQQGDADEGSTFGPDDIP